MYGAAVNAYRKTSLSVIQEPEKAVKLLFEGAIKELKLAKEYINKPLKLSKHIGKSIAIVGELQAGLNFEKGGEAAEFLNGLYSAIIRELSKVKGENELQVIELSIKYLSELKKIWEKYVLNSPNGQENTNNNSFKGLKAVI